MRELSRREFVKYASAGVVAGAVGLGGMRILGAEPAPTAAAAETPAPSRTPNILFIFSDQQHWQAAGFQDPFFATPNLDALARESVVFERSFCTTPQCSPSRASLLTGLYSHRTGVWGNVGATGGQPLKAATLGTLLAKTHRTAYFGKWHLGNEAAAARAWNGPAADRFNPPGGDAGSSAAGIDFLRAADPQKRPFALFLSYENPHDIYTRFPAHKIAPADRDVPLPPSWHKETFQNKPLPQKEFMTEDQGAPIWDKPESEWKRYRDCYREMVRLYDVEVGKVIDALKTSGHYEDTIIVVTSDHGDMDTQHRLIFKGPFMYEHMVRVPLLIRVPAAFGGIKPQRESGVDVVGVDLFPTLLEFAGLAVPACDGISLKPLLTGQPGQARRDCVIGQYYSKQQWVTPIRMIRTPDLKYNRYAHWGEELYDLAADPNELVNLAANPKYAPRKKELSDRLDKWMAETNDPFPTLKATDRNGKPLKGV